ncbi:MAG: TauD/TfdA family dioxygenase [Novosphingobium sp.]|nr:TauD/TfdA family dioxygenase [Novosphingobium sp.]
MNFTVEPIDATFGVMVTDLDASTLDDDSFAQLYALWLDHALLVLPQQHLTREQQIAFAGRFGPAESGIFDISTVRPDGDLRREEIEEDASFLNMLRGNYDWHADGSYGPALAKGAVYSAQVVPKQGGETGWADMRAAHDALDDELRARVETLAARHSIQRGQARRGLVHDERNIELGPEFNPLRSLVRRHPETGRKSLMMGRHAYSVPEMTDTESRIFLDGLVEFACRPPRVYFHDWQPGDVVVWDNRSLLHCVKPWDMREPRVMWHAGISGSPESDSILSMDQVPA